MGKGSEQNFGKMKVRDRKKKKKWRSLVKNVPNKQKKKKKLFIDDVKLFKMIHFISFHSKDLMFTSINF